MPRIRLNLPRRGAARLRADGECVHEVVRRLALPDQALSREQVMTLLDDLASRAVLLFNRA